MDGQVHIPTPIDQQTVNAVVEHHETKNYSMQVLCYCIEVIPVIVVVKVLLKHAEARVALAFSRPMFSVSVCIVAWCTHKETLLG